MYIHIIDIAHPALDFSTAEEKLHEEVRAIRSSHERRVLKVIHGIGTERRPSVLKEVVRNWAYRNRSRLRDVIPGEEYDLFNKKTICMRTECGQIADSDLGAGNRGITLIWVV